LDVFVTFLNHTLLSIFELGNLRVLILTIVGLRDNIVGNDKNDCCICKVL